MPLGAAAEAAGVSTATVRAWRKAGTIAERRAPGRGATIEVFLTPGHCPPESTDDRDGTRGSAGPNSESGVLVPLEIHQRSLAELILRLTDTTERAVRAEARVELLEAQLAEARRSSAGGRGTLEAASPPRRKKG